MTTPTDVVSADAVSWAADQIVRMHTEAPPHPFTKWAETPMCAHCQHDQRCAMLTWALVVLANGPSTDDDAGT